MITKVDGRIAHITALIDHVSHRIAIVKATTILRGTAIGLQYQREVHTVFTRILPGTVADELLVEPEVAPVLQVRRDLTSLCIECIGAELHAIAQRTFPSRQDVGDDRVADVGLIVADGIGWPRTKDVDGTHLPFVLVEIHRYFGVQVAFVLKRLLQIFATEPRQ